MTHCRICSENTINLLWQDYQGAWWFACESCGCHSSSNSYEQTKHLYDSFYLEHHHGGITIEEEREQLRSNVDWFEDYKPDTKGRDFLDVGCARGVAMSMMAEKEWRVHGFDVIPEAKQPGCSTIASTFTAGLFPQKYHAVMCREVIEHVDHPLQMLTELSSVTQIGGYLQLQTPRPTHKQNNIGYQSAHITLLTPFLVRTWLTQLGFEIKDYRLWDIGQCWMAKKVA